MYCTLSHSLGDQPSIAELREIAREVGIAPSSFEQALTELRNRSLHADAEARSLETRRVADLGQPPWVLL